MLSFIPSWRTTPSPIVQFCWATDTVNLRFYFVEKGISEETIQKCVSSVATVCSLRRDVEAFARNFAQTLSTQEIGEAFDGNFNEMVTQAKDLVLRGTTEPTKNFGKRDIISRMLHQFFVAMERFLKRIGLLDLLEPAMGPKENEVKKTQTLLLSTIATWLSTTLISSLGPLHGGLITAGIVGFLSVFVLSYPLWKPFPSFLPKVENWTEKYKQGKLEVFCERKELLDRIDAALKASKWSGRQPMLVGESGSGKTELLKTLVQKYARELPDHNVLYLNTPELSKQPDWTPELKPPLYFLSGELEGNREKATIIFDQIDRALDPDPNYRIADSLKRMMDSSSEHFPRMVSVTTSDLYDEMVKKDRGFVDRFTKINVNKPNDQEILQILEKKLYKKYPDALLEEGTLEYLQEKGVGKDIRELISLLGSCAQRTSKEQKTELEKEELDALFEAKKELLEMKKSLFQIASDSTFGQNEEEQKFFFVLQKLLIPSIETCLKAKASEKGINLWIDRSVVDSVIL